MKEKKLLFGILLVFIFIISIGLTYAYFSVTSNVEGEATDMEVSVGTLNVLFADGPEISLPEAYPGDSASKTFTVKNNGSLEAYYKINWQEFDNEITKDELVVSFTCISYSTYLGVGNAENVVSGKCDNLTEEAVYDRDLKTNIRIPVGYTHVYNLTIKLLDINVAQNYNQGVNFSGVLQVEGDSPSWVELCEGNNSLRCRVINDNIPVGQAEVPRDDASSTYVTSSSGIDFAAKSSLTNGQGLYRNTKIGDGDNYYFRGDNFCAYTDYINEDEDGTKCTAVGGTWDGDTYKCSLDYSESTCSSKGYTYYRLNNNVSFNGFMWKIIRIDDEGNVRLLYNGTSTTARGTSAHVGRAMYSNDYKYSDNAYVGYMQPDNQPVTDVAFTTTKEQAESNEISSPLKTLVDNWYRDNIANKTNVITSKIGTSTGFCNDRRMVTVDGGFGNNNTNYASYNRLNVTHTPSYKCEHESNDLFTAIGTTYGNKELTYPVGLMTADEIVYSGSTYDRDSYNFRVYTHSGNYTWTLSPSIFLTGVAYPTYVSSDSSFSYNVPTNNGGARVVISLNSTATVNAALATGGNGSLETPYVIE